MKTISFRNRQPQGAQLRARPARRSFYLAMPILLGLLVSLVPLHAAPHRGLGPSPGYGPLGDLPQNNPQSDYWTEWRLMNSSTDRLLKTIGATNAEAARLLRQVQTNATFLHGKWDEWFNTHVRSKIYAPADTYLSSVRANNRQLSSLKKESDPAKVLAVIRDVAFDMQIKADNCRHSEDGLGKEIRVKVHTKAGGKEIGGYEVFYVSKGMFDVKSAHDRFPRQSSPTDEKIFCPGGYMLWVRKKDFSSEPVSMGIGGRGETRLEVDLEVPAE